MASPEIFLPTSDLTRSDYWLHDPRSCTDLGSLGDDLVEGLEVLLRTPQGETLKARLGFQHEVNCWIAYPVRSRSL
jgi:hypothetical protein